ncbi:MAG: tetratricopeptide repeat protein [Candidatus Gastranaerophilales bacterium]|nr:tetratricopeptide repeat protein [Candidatus Gastranaerophilales bacterium]
MIVFLIFLILIVFSIVWALVWFWFFKGGEVTISMPKLYRNVDKSLKKNDYQTAKESLMEILKANPNIDDKCQLGFVHFKLEEYDQARACFEEILKTSPQNFDALFHLAQIFQMQKNYDEALEFYEKAMNENDKDLDCYLNIGSIYYEQKKYEKASEILEKAKEFSPGDVQVLFYSTKYKNALSDSSQIEDYTQVINDYVEISDSNNLPKEFDISLAKTYAKNGDIYNAIEHCQRAIEINDKDIEAYRLLGLIQLINKDFVNAKNNLTIALNLQSNSPETHELFSYLLCSKEKDCGLKRCREKYYKMIKKQLKQ